DRVLRTSRPPRSRSLLGKNILAQQRLSGIFRAITQGRCGDESRFPVPWAGGGKMAAHVNLDALIYREDFEAISDLDDTQVKDSSPITDFTLDAFFYGALRKPDFQRETAEWEPDRVVGLIRSFVDGELIPGVIVWKNKGLVFVIDGSHRLSALIAWVQDDYGD